MQTEAQKRAEKKYRSSEHVKERYRTLDRNSKRKRNDTQNPKHEIVFVMEGNRVWDETLKS
jgi:hypothetical protein